MTKEIFYKKVGRKYVPVSEYDSVLMEAMPKGSHLVNVYPGGQSTRYSVNPNHVALLAACRVAEDAISKAIMDATEIRRSTRGGKNETPLTEEQRDAWNHLVDVFGPDAKQLEWPSARECAEKAAQAIMIEAEKLMSVPSVQKAYEHFLLMAELTKDNNESSS
jgi:hypothetical protein